MPTLTEKVADAAAVEQPKLAEPAGGSPWLASGREKTLLVILALVALAIAVYAPSLHNGFVDLDDGPYITENPVVAQGLSWPGVVWAFHTSAQSNWHPLTWISLMADVQLFGLKPGPIHVVNMLLHCLNVVLLFFFLRAATGRLMRSAVVAALFAVFPMNVEAVAWAVERKSVLSMAFFLAALLLYVSYARRPAALKYAGIMALFSLSLLAKTWGITFPFLLLLLDFWPFERIGFPGRDRPGRKGWAGAFGKLVWEKAPLFAISAGCIYMGVWAARQAGELSSVFARAPLRLRLENSLWSYLQYLVKGLWPVRLSILYPFPRTMLAPWRVALAAGVLLSVTWLVWRLRERRYFVVGWLWFLGSLVPMIGIVQGGPQAWGNRFAYISFLGLFVMAVWGVAEALPMTPRAQTIAGALCAILIVAYACEARIQVGYWRSGYTIFTRALQVTPENAVAEDDLGIALDQELGRPDLAMPHYQRAVQIMPELSFAHYNLATELHKQNRLDEASREYRLALANQPDPSEVALIHANLGAILRAQKDWQGARAEYTLALRVSPNDPINLTNRGGVEAQAADLPAARADLQRAEQMYPNPVTSFMLARVLEDSGDLAGAAAAFETVLKMDPGATEAKARIESIRQKMH